MMRWEYLVIDSFDMAQGRFIKTAPNRESIQAYLNELGAQGWEIVNIDFFETTDRTNFMALAKRPVEAT